MSETDTLAPPAVVELPQAVPARRRRLWPLLGLIGFLVLAAGEAWLWHLQQPAAAAPAEIAALQNGLAGVRSGLAAAQSQAAANTRPAPDSVTAQADLAQKLAALTAQVNAMQSQLAADHGALTKLSANSTDVTKLSAKMALLDRLAGARMALDAGQPLGVIPNAPPALARFAAVAPPTQAQLQLDYPKAAMAADDASATKADKGGIWAGALARLENLVTVSDGDRVVLGAPAAAITTQAQTRLNAGDLAGAVAVLTNGLSAGTQAAMGDWLARAQALLAARAAMAAMAGAN